ncbi:hypothetical protein M0813_15588 [Anaeramoeba flamelloides]|uniref:BTB domain-containing protein n=1 Tax=Anaeramoeba flamelloides TaxID=1746091 RepID=A0ABQ8Z1L1_9EUKA|nr:hypothetical protein M0813_15588 [Anaeramoeba flamelloides]
MTNVFLFGVNTNGKLGLKSQGEIKELKKPDIDPLDKLIVQDVAFTNTQSCFLTSEGEVYNVNSSYSSTKLEMDKIKQIHGLGSNHFFALSFSGKVYSWGYSSSSYGQLGIGNSGSQTSPQHLKYFDDKNPIKVFATEAKSFVLCEGGNVYAMGINNESDLGIGNTTNQMSPVLAHKEVDKLWVGHGGQSFELGFDKKLYGFGSNSAGQLGLNDFSVRSKPTKIPFFDDKLVVEMALGYSHSLAITKEGKVYATGSSNYFGGSSGNQNTFQELTKFSKTRVTHVAAGQYSSLILTETGELTNYGQYFNEGDYYYSAKEVKVPFKINENVIEMRCGAGSYCCAILTAKDLIYDMKDIFKSGAVSDKTISNINYHNVIFEARIPKNRELLLRVLNGYGSDEVQQFLNWVYTGAISNEIVVKIANASGIQGIESYNLSDDLRKLSKDEESYDFTILVKIEDEEEDEEEEEEEENEEEEEEDYEEIPCHKVILAARSKLFRDMFENIKEEANTVKDISGKSFECLEVFVNYLYTDQIEFTADHDVESILEELEDAGEYYQLYQELNFKMKLDKIKASRK